MVLGSLRFIRWHKWKPQGLLSGMAWNVPYQRCQETQYAPPIRWQHLRGDHHVFRENDSHVIFAAHFHQDCLFLFAFFVCFFFQNVGSTILKPLKHILIWLKFHSGFSECFTEALKPTCSQFWVSMGSTLMLLSCTQHNQQLRITMTLGLTSVSWYSRAIFATYHMFINACICHIHESIKRNQQIMSWVFIHNLLC